MEDKLNNIFEFLKDNTHFNQKLQEQEYRTVLCVNGSQNDKVINLLYHVVNTQSQPKMDPLSDFYRLIYNNKNAINSFEDFVYLLSGKRSLLYSDLYHSLKSQRGWGQKV